MNRTKQKVDHYPIVRHDQLLEIIRAATPEERLFRFLQFTHWLQNSMKRSWKDPLHGIGLDFIYSSGGCNLDLIHRKLARVSRVWARHGYEVIRKLKEDLQEYRSSTDTAKTQLHTSTQFSNICHTIDGNQTQYITQKNNITKIDEEECRDRILFKEIKEPNQTVHLNIIGQVISVMESSNKEMILRIWDGTKHRFNSFQERIPVFHLEATSITRIIVPSIGSLKHIPANYYIDIICCGEWGRLTSQLRCNQGVYLRNVQFFSPKFPINQPRAFYLRSGGANKRGIYFLPPLMSSYLTLTLSTTLISEGFGNKAPPTYGLPTNQFIHQTNVQHNYLQSINNNNNNKRDDNTQQIEDIFSEDFWMND